VVVTVDGVVVVEEVVDEVDESEPSSLEPQAAVSGLSSTAAARPAARTCERRVRRMVMVCLGSCT
jgi:cob(I)alamin adenosyltransferase